MGTVRFNRQRKKWQIDYTAATGERVRQLVGPGEEGKRLAKQILRQREAEAQLGIYNLPSSRTMKFGAFAEDWLRRAAGRNLAAKTFESYEGMIRCHLVPAFGGKNLGAITRRDVELFLAEAKTAYKKPTPLSPKTAGYALTLLKAILEDAVDHDHLRENPAARVRPPVRPDRDQEMRVLNPGEIQKLLDADRTGLEAALLPRRPHGATPRRTARPAAARPRPIPRVAARSAQSAPRQGRRGQTGGTAPHCEGSGAEHSALAADDRPVAPGC